MHLECMHTYDLVSKSFETSDTSAKINMIDVYKLIKLIRSINKMTPIIKHNYKNVLLNEASRSSMDFLS